MSQDVFKVPCGPKIKRRHGHSHKSDFGSWPPQKRRRTKDDFFAFCNIVLEYAQYDMIKEEDLRARNNTSPLDSIGSTAESFTSESTTSSISEPEPDDRHNGSPSSSSSSLSSLGYGHSSEDTSHSYSHNSYSHNHSSNIYNHSNHRSHAKKSSVNNTGADVESDDDSYDLITCYCMKPFAGRPMIECSECLTWIHLSCAKIRKSNIPEEFICQQCRESKFTTRKSNRVRSEKRPLNA